MPSLPTHVFRSRAQFCKKLPKNAKQYHYLSIKPCRNSLVVKEFYCHTHINLSKLSLSPISPFSTQTTSCQQECTAKSSQISTNRRTNRSIIYHPYPILNHLRPHSSHTIHSISLGVSYCNAIWVPNAEMMFFILLRVQTKDKRDIMDIYQKLVNKTDIVP